jgi:hypothetical protein
MCLGENEEMPNLEAAIDQIHRWIRDNAPHREALLQPPLTRQQMDDLLGNTGIVLPEEVYALYSWRNGVADEECFFPGYRFTPLEEAVEDMVRLWEDEYLRGPREYTWLFVFQVYATYGGYAVFCDAQPRRTNAVDYDGTHAASDTLTDLTSMIADRFEDGCVIIDDEGELEFPDRFALNGLDRDFCYLRIRDEDWETISQAVLRIGLQVAVDRNDQFAIDNILQMFRDPSSRIWQEPLILHDCMSKLNFSRRAESQAMMAQLLQHPERSVRWFAVHSVGNSQYFQQYAWMRDLADYFAHELTQPMLPQPYRDDLILAFGKTGDARAIPLLQQLKQQRDDMTGVVALMCLQRVHGISG